MKSLRYCAVKCISIIASWLVNIHYGPVHKEDFLFYCMGKICFADTGKICFVDTLFNMQVGFTIIDKTIFVSDPSHQTNQLSSASCFFFSLYNFVSDVKYGILFICINLVKTQSMPPVNLNKSRYRFCVYQLSWYKCSYRNNNLHQIHELWKEKHEAVDNWLVLMWWVTLAGINVLIEIIIYIKFMNCEKRNMKLSTTGWF